MVPETVQGEARELYENANAIRTAIKDVAKNANALRFNSIELLPKSPENGEAIANATLAFRHLEDASMRLGKVLQALDGGVSVYDRATTVGA